MKRINELHNKAMDLAEIAFLERKKGNFDESNKLFNEAFLLEKQAAMSITDFLSSEPSRSILFRSAASLALNYNNYREAERMIALALSGNPPIQIANELRDLYEQVNFERHLELKGIQLEKNELQLSISGKGSGFGIVQIDEFKRRIEIFEKFTYRTAERKLGRPFRERGAVKKDIKNEFEPFISAPRAASFAVTIRIGGCYE